MAPSTIRKALGAVKDQTSIGLAKVSCNIAPDLDVAIVKATSHNEEPADDKYLREILSLTSFSRGYVGACVATLSRRLGKTRDWIVAIKTLILIHRLLSDGDPAFHHEILYATRRHRGGTRLLNMSDFRDEAHSNSWDQSAFVQTYALYLDQRLECIIYDVHKPQRRDDDGGGGRWRSPPPPPPPPPHHRSSNYYRSSDYYSDPYTTGGSNRPPLRDEQQQDTNKPLTPLREMKPERILGRMHQLQQLLDRFLACRPTGTAKQSRLILIALYAVVRESFQLYADICEILAILLDRFFDMDYPDCVKSFEAYAAAAKQIDELSAFYAWCRDTGVARSSEYPQVQCITNKLLETLEEFVRDRSKVINNEPPPPAIAAPPVEQEEVLDMNSIKALPAPEGYKENEDTPPPTPPPPMQKEKQEESDLMNLRDVDAAASAEDQSNRLALALFSGDEGGASSSSWESFPGGGGAKAADWEVALVESASSLSKQRPNLAGGFDPLLLGGMYDQGSVRQHQGAAQLSGGSASSVALPSSHLTGGVGKVLALPAPDGSGAMQVIGQDPFASSLSVPPPSYVQMADMEKKQQLLVQEQLMWNHYATDGMHGQVTLAKMQQHHQPLMMPYTNGMPHF